MANSPSHQETSLKWFLRQWYAGLFTILVIAGFLFTKSPPRESLFVTQERIARTLKLILGSLYLMIDGLPVILGGVIIAVVVFSVSVFVRHLIIHKRWPTLIPVLLLIALNFMLIGAPNFVLSRSVSPRDIRCEFFVTSQTGIRIVRYPLDTQRNYAEQQFFMISFDGGATWGQFTHSFIYDPLIERCNGVEFNDDLNGTIVIERSIDPITMEYLTYQTTDGGQNWEIVTREQP